MVCCLGDCIAGNVMDAALLLMASTLILYYGAAGEIKLYAQTKATLGSWTSNRLTTLSHLNLITCLIVLICLP